MYVISWPLWVVVMLILAGVLAIGLSVNPYSPLVRYVIASRAQGTGRWIWTWPVLTSVTGVVLILLGLLLRPW
jgi:hypothetical protein